MWRRLREEKRAQEARERQEVKVQGEHWEEERGRTQKEDAGEKKEEENRHSMYEDSDVSNRHTAWWKRSRWIWVDGGSSMRSARGSRRIWRAARRAAAEASDEDGVGEAQRQAEEAEEEKVGKGKRERATDRETGQTAQKKHSAHRLALASNGNQQ